MSEHTQIAEEVLRNWQRDVSSRPLKVSETVDRVVEDQMRQDNETTASNLPKILVNKGFDLSFCTVLHSRITLGWTYRGSSFCQLICESNKAKRLQFAIANLHDSFEDVIVMDECSVQLKIHRHYFFCRKKSEHLVQNPGIQ